MRAKFAGMLYASAVVLAIAIPAFSQAIPAGTRNWWAPVNTTRDVTEKGKFSELQTKKKVYVNVSFAEARLDSPISPAERRAVEREVKEAVSSQKGLQLVNVPETAEF